MTCTTTNEKGMFDVATAPELDQRKALIIFSKALYVTREVA
jgi:hypothetical protein